MYEISIEEIRALKKKYGLSNAKLSDESGVPIGTVNKVLSGATESPRNETLVALAKPLLEREEKHAYYTQPAPENSCVAEEAVRYGKPSDDTGRHEKISDDAARYGKLSDDAVRYGKSSAENAGTFTIDDYLALPDERRVELIDGFFYDMAAPTTIHQSIALTFAFELKAYIKKHDGKCMPFISPVDVQLSPLDAKTMVQPDVFIVCDPSKITEKRILGAPDFILEIISPSTCAKDYYKKAAKYHESGVREYWVIDPIRGRLTVYYFETEEPILVCPLAGKIGIGIYNGELQIDLDEIAALCSL